MTTPSAASAPGDEFAAMFAASGMPGLAAATQRSRGREPRRYLKLTGARIIDMG